MRWELWAFMRGKWRLLLWCFEVNEKTTAAFSTVGAYLEGRHVRTMLRRRGRRVAA